MSSFSFDADALERAVLESADKGVRKIANDLQRTVDQLSATHRGKPVDEIKPVLVDDWRRASGGQITDPQLTEWATAIHEGRKINIRYNGIGL